MNEINLNKISKTILLLTEDLVNNSTYQPFGDETYGKPLIIKFEKQKIKSIKFRLQCNEVLHLQRVDFLCGGKSVISEGSLVKKIDTKESSIFKDDINFKSSRLLEKHGIYHSKKECEPSVEFIFSSLVEIDEIKFYNFNFPYFYRAFSIAVFVREDGCEYKCVHDNWKSKKALINLVNSISKDSISDIERVILYLAVSAAFCDLNSINHFLSKITARYNELVLKDVYSIVNKFLSFSGYGFNQHGLIRPFGLMPENNLKQIVYELAEILEQIKDKLGYEAFLTSGTLLGAYRDKKLIKNDDDIDIAIFMRGRNDKEVVCERLELLESLNSIGIASTDSSHVQIQCKLTSGVNVDIFPVWQSSEGVALSPLPRGVLKNNDLFPLAHIKLYEKQLPVPRNIENVLINNYGAAWVKPDPSWRFDWDKANAEYSDFLGEK